MTVTGSGTPGTPSTGPAKRGGLLRRAVRRLTTEDEVMDAADLRRDSQSFGATAVTACMERQRVTVAGTVRSLTLRPRSGAPTLEVEVYDGSGSVTLVWLGRRELAGVSVGRRLRATGCLTSSHGQHVIYNPSYELIVDEH